MKKCPQCGREYDNTMSFCLDDGSELLYGPASASVADEPVTAILHSSVSPPFSANDVTRPFSTGGDRSIVVMPFTSIGSGEDDYFGDGLTEEIITDLSSVRSLRVISRNSAMRLKGTEKDVATIVQELNVRYLLDGSVRKSGQALRISVQLIDGFSDAILWSEKYAGTLDDIFQMQENVSLAVVNALKITLSPEEERQIEERPIANPQAYDLYLRSRAAFLKGDPAALDQSIVLLNQAIEIIGANDLLYAALGYAHYFYFRWISKLDRSRLDRAEEFMKLTFEVNPASSHAFVLQGHLSYSRGDMVGTRLSLQKAVELEPTNTEVLFWLGINYAYIGETGKAKDYIDKVHSLDPLMPINIFIRGFTHVYSGEFEECLPYMERALALDSSSPLMIWSAVVIEAWAGKFDDAIKHADQLALMMPHWVYTEHALFLKHALRGEREKALQHYSPDFDLEAAYDCHFALHVAHCFALIGDVDRAIDFLDIAVRAGLAHPNFLAEWDPLLANVRGSERFGGLIALAEQEHTRIVTEAPTL